jgi:hypothetical protein
MPKPMTNIPWSMRTIDPFLRVEDLMTMGLALRGLISIESPFHYLALRIVRHNLSSIL